MKIKYLLIAIALLPLSVKAQQMQFFRPNNQQGINVFETKKADTVAFNGLQVKVGGNFAMAFQMLRNYNTALPATRPGFTGNVNSLIPLSNGFNLPMANLNIDAQLADGIRLNLTSYLSSRHHENTWVKGGYVQFDKLLFLKSDIINEIMKSVTIKIGQSDLDYGDQHFRRSDGGNTIHNPFIENYLMDAFATEIGANLYYHHKTGLFAMSGITNGALNTTVVAPTKIDAATGQVNKYPPAYLGKIGFDKQLNADTRVRLTGSFYTVSSANNSTLYNGDRTGSHYYFVMSNPNIAAGTTLNSAVDYNAFSGRFNPGFNQEVHAAMGNLFLKHKGLEFFGTYERSNGRTITEVNNRNATQYAADLIYRFPASTENFWVGARYNTVIATIQGVPNDVRVNRTVASAGWFMTKNIMMKAEYVNQVYNNYPNINILNGGKIQGVMLQASIGF